jgi:hypothetical protein
MFTLTATKLDSPVGKGNMHLSLEENKNQNNNISDPTLMEEDGNYDSIMGIYINN